MGDTITYCESDMDTSVPTLALITEWIVPYPTGRSGAAMKTKVVFDGRNPTAAIVVEAGFDYYGIGMGENIAESISNAKSTHHRSCRVHRNAHFNQVSKRGLGCYRN